MASRANFKAKVELDSTAFTKGVRSVSQAASKMARGVKSSMKSIGSGVAKMGRAMVKITKVVGVATAAFAAFGTVLIKNSIAAANRFESLSVSMATFVGGTAKASAILKEISAFSVATPFETEGLQKATNKLLSAGIAADSVVDILKEMSATAKDTQQVEELADALAKGFAKGKFQTEELNKFLERGINLMPELTRVTGASGAELQKLIQDGLKFDDVREAIAGMSREGGLFFGMLDKQSKTASGLVSTLASNWDEFKRALGTPIAEGLKPHLEKAITMMQNLTGSAAKFGEMFSDVMEKALAKVSEGIANVSDAFHAGTLGDTVGLTVQLGLSRAADFFADKMANIVAALASTLNDPHFWNAAAETAAGFLGSAYNIGAKLAGASGDQLFDVSANGKNAAESFNSMLSGGSLPGSGSKETARALDDLVRSNRIAAMDREIAESERRSMASRRLNGGNFFDTVTGLSASGGAPQQRGSTGKAPGVLPQMGGIAVLLAGAVKTALQIAMPAIQVASLQGEGFGGLARGAMMQNALASGIGPGMGAIGGKVGSGGAGIGVQGATGLQGALGGLGAKTKEQREREKLVEAEKKAQAEKMKSVEGTNELLTETNSLLAENLTLA